MANIWLARTKGKAGFEKLFAVKTILPHVADDPAFKNMFLDEARIASRIMHPNVVHMVDVGEHDGTPYLVMDLVEGEPLYKLPRACEKKKIKMPLGVVLRIVADACHGLHAAHELTHMGTLLNVVHRDVSPQNILVSSAGISKVIDFGVAKARDRATQETSAGTLKGKISYMPTEQARGHEVDRRADTWALGAVLYWLLAGRPPYKEENQLATLQLAVTAAPIPPLPESVPVELRLVVMQALEHERQLRFQTAEQLGTALEELMPLLGVSASHADVAAFVELVIGERIEKKRRQIRAAIAEADDRGLVRSTPAIPIDLDDTAAVLEKAGFVDIPSAISSALEHAQASAPRLPTLPLTELIEPEPAQPPSTTTITGGPDGSTTGAGTFIAAEAPPPKRKLWPVLLGAVFMLIGIIGVVFIVVTLKNGVHEVPTENPVAFAESAKPTETAPAIPPPPENKTAEAKPAAPAPPTKASSVPTPASASAPATTAKPSPPPPVQQVQPPPANTKPKKRHDDDPGF